MQKMKTDNPKKCQEAQKPNRQGQTRALSGRQKKGGAKTNRGYEDVNKKTKQNNPEDLERQDTRKTKERSSCGRARRARHLRFEDTEKLHSKWDQQVCESVRGCVGKQKGFTQQSGDLTPPRMNGGEKKNGQPLQYIIGGNLKGGVKWETCCFHVANVRSRLTRRTVGIARQRSGGGKKEIRKPTREGERLGSNKKESRGSLWGEVGKTGRGGPLNKVRSQECRELKW